MPNIYAIVGSDDGRVKEEALRLHRELTGVESLKDCLEAGLGKGVVFLLSATGIDKRRAFWKFLEKNGQVRAFDKIDTSREGWQEEVADLVEKRAKDLGLRFENEALELF